jgi:hypothetical protein
MNSPQIRIFLSSCLGVFIGAALAIAAYLMDYWRQDPLSVAAQISDEAAGEFEIPVKSVLSGGSLDSDGDGIPDSWEALFAHDLRRSADASADFDFDGLTALEEYQLHEATDGEFGNPLGTYELVTASPVPGYVDPPAITLLESASNGMSVLRVIGVPEGAASSVSRVYTYHPATDAWLHVKLPGMVEASVTATDVNCRGQVVGYYSSGGIKGFVWTPVASSAAGGESLQFFINPTSASPQPAIPRRISDSGCFLYSLSTSTGSPWLPADPAQRRLTPVSDSYPTTRYVDVNDFGEFVGTVFDPFVGAVRTFLSIPEGPFFLARFSHASAALEIGIEAPPEVGLGAIVWGEFDFSTVVAGGDHARYGQAVDPATLQPYEFRETYWSREIWWRPHDGAAPQSWRKLHSEVAPAAINDWGEFAGSFNVTSTSASHEVYQGGVEPGGGMPESLTSHGYAGSFFFDGDYRLTLAAGSVFGVSNDPQVLIGSRRADRIWSDGVVAPILKLLPAGSLAPAVVKLCDGGVLIFQMGTQSLQVLYPCDDADADGMPDDWEAFHGLNPLAADGHLDADGDGIANLAEFRLRSDPNQAPVFVNGAEVDVRPGIDTDGDGMPNAWELHHGLNYRNPADAGLDFDRDGYTNLQEFRLGTDPRGAPAFRALALGPFPGASSVANLFLTDGAGAAPAAPPDGENLTESVLLRATPASAAAGGFARPAAFRFHRRNSTGTFDFYPSGSLASASTYLAHALNGASIASASGTFFYWPGPSQAPVMLSGAAAAHNATAISNPRFSPSGTYLVGTRRLASTGAHEPFVWKMPISPAEAANPKKPIKLTPPTGATLSTNAVLDVNDLGQVVATGAVSGQSRPILWELAPDGNSASGRILLPLAGATSHTALGLSNSHPLRIAGTANFPGRQRAVVWNAAGLPTDLGTLPSGTSSVSAAISPNGSIAGISTVQAGESLLKQPFVATFDSSSGSWILKAQGAPGYDFTLTSLNDIGELLGTLRQTTPVIRNVPTLWRHGRGYALDDILPPASGYLIDTVTALNRSGTLLATAWSGGAKIHVILTPDQDTDGDGLPDAFENQHGLNPLVKVAPGTDSDGDGLCDLEEYRQGTNPRNPDTDGDGMTDGWEVAWGLLPVDPSDALLDPDADHVTNFREFQLQTNPTGIYRLDPIVTADTYVPSVITANQDGHVIHSGTSSYDDEPVTIGVDWFEQKSTATYHHSQPGAPPAPARTSQLLIPSGSVSRNNSSWSINEYRSETASHWLEASGGNVHSAVQGYIYNLNNGFIDYQEYAYLIPADLQAADRNQWIPWESVQAALRNPAAGSGIAPLGSLESLYPFAASVSTSGTRRIHLTSTGRQLLLNQRGEAIADLGTEIAWQKINNQGHVFGLVIEHRPAAGGLPATPVPILKIRRESEVDSIELPSTPGFSSATILHAVSDDGKVLLSRSLRNQQLGTYRMYELLDTSSRKISPARMPGLGSESILALSEQEGCLLGTGPEPFHVTADGTCIRLAAIRIQSTATDPPLPLGDLYPGPLGAAHIAPNGTITLVTRNAANQHVILQAIRHNDANQNGIPDDWEKDFAEWVLEADRSLGRLTAQQKAQLQAGNLDPQADYTGDQLSAADQFQLAATFRGLVTNPAGYDFIRQTKILQGTATLEEESANWNAMLQGDLQWRGGSWTADENLAATTTPANANFTPEGIQSHFNRQLPWQDLPWQLYQDVNDLRDPSAPVRPDWRSFLQAASSYRQHTTPPQGDFGKITEWSFTLWKTRFKARRQAPGIAEILIPMIEETLSIPIDESGVDLFNSQVSYRTIEVVIPSKRMTSDLIDLDSTLENGELIIKSLMPVALVPDYNRDGKIDHSDYGKVTSANPWRWWINDDNDEKSAERSSSIHDIPKQGSGDRDCNDLYVDGMRDLLDFFPLHLDLASVLAVLPSSQFKYVVKHAESAFNFYEFPLTVLDGSDPGRSPNCHVKQVGVGRGLASKKLSRAYLNGSELTEKMLDNAQNGKGVIVVEGAKKTELPLILEIRRRSDNTSVVELCFPVKITDVERMYRHVNFRDFTGGSGGRKTEIEEPVDYPDVLTNGKYVGAVHGYHVDGAEARGFHSNIFKRLHQLGSRARFVGISWFGNPSNPGVNLALPPDYHRAVYNALITGHIAKARLTFTQESNLTIMAHSLGNVLVGNAVANYGLNVDQYYIINGAVPIEAYDSLQTSNSSGHLDMKRNMTEDDWKPYYDYDKGQEQRLFAANWHKLFHSTDERSKLTWNNLFASPKLLLASYNFYSPTDEVVENPDATEEFGDLDNLRSAATQGRHAWVQQEIVKGGQNAISGNAFHDLNGGWGFNSYWDPPSNGAFSMKRRRPPIETASMISDADLTTKPFHRPLLYPDLYVPLRGSTTAGIVSNRYKLLATGIPATSYAIAVNSLDQLDLRILNGPSRNFNLPRDFKSPGGRSSWPPHENSMSPGDWMHSDFNEVALHFMYPMFEKMIDLADLNS